MNTEYDKRRQLQQDKDNLLAENKKLKEITSGIKEINQNAKDRFYKDENIDGLTMKMNEDENIIEVYEQKLSVKLDSDKEEVTFKNLTYKYNGILNICHYIKEDLLNKEQK